MNLLSLSLLEAIVRTGSYSGAAKEKNFSVAKVSFHINNRSKRAEFNSF